MTKARRGPRLGLGPVFAFEWAACSRRWWWYGLRSAFAGSLLAALAYVAGNSVDTGDTRALARLGESFYFAVIGTQLTLVMLAAPAATAGAVCHDRATGMMTHVLVTDLSDSELVLGKLAARLVPVLGLIACALPMMTILSLMGGVDPAALAGAFATTVAVATLGCSLAFAFSLWASKPFEALLGTYAVWAIWLMGRPFVRLLNSGYGLSLDLPGGLSDPYSLSFAPYWRPGTVGFGDYAWFVTACLAASALLAALAVFRLRAVCTRTNVARKGSLRDRLATLGDRVDPARRLPEPPLDFNPVVWREWRRGRPSGMGKVLGGLFALGAATASVAAVLMPWSSFAMAWVNGLQVSIGMLLLAVTAATSLSEERVRGSLDVLMTTTLSTREIVLGKWLGALRGVPAMALPPTLVVLVGGFSRPGHVAVVVMTLLFVLVCGAAVVSLGLLAATWIARPARALAATVTVYVLVAVGCLFAGIFVGGARRDGLMMASTFYFPGELAADLCSGHGLRNDFGWGLFWLMAYGTAALVFLGATLATFNLCLGRVEVGTSAVLRAGRAAIDGVRGRPVADGALDHL